MVKDHFPKNKIGKWLSLGALAGLLTSIGGGSIYRALLPATFYAQTQPSVTSVYYNNNWRAILTTGDALGRLTTIAEHLVIRTDDAVYVARPVQHTGRLNPLGNTSYTASFLYGQDVRIVPVEEALPILEAHKKYLRRAVGSNQFEVISPLHASDSDTAVRSPNVIDTYVSRIRYYLFMDEIIPRVEVFGTENPLRVGQSAGSLAARDLEAFQALVKKDGLKGPEEFATFCRANQIGYKKWAVMPWGWIMPASAVTFTGLGLAGGLIASLRRRQSEHTQ